MVVVFEGVVVVVFEVAGVVDIDFKSAVFFVVVIVVVVVVVVVIVKLRFEKSSVDGLA